MQSVDEMDPVAEARVYYAAALDRGVERFFGPRSSRCPWCGGERLRRRVTCRDLRQFKPGRFRLDACRSCGHVFQNPALTDEGLGFYYRDAYDGLNAETAEAHLASNSVIYRSRAETVARHRSSPPRRWLDVGTASAHFPEVAASVFPDTVFDGLDMSDGVLAGEKAGRISKAVKGQLPEVSSELAASYDQVSMFHYLEHTRDPFADLDAALEVLTDDGWLFIEQPDPEARAARILRSWWPGWNQPEHLHMITCDNLVRALDDRGMEVVAVEHREAHVPLEMFVVVVTLLNLVAPVTPAPWRYEELPRFATLRRRVVKWLLAPPMAVAVLCDWVILPKVLRSYHAYRILARKKPR